METNEDVDFVVDDVNDALWWRVGDIVESCIDCSELSFEAAKNSPGS
jgi:hypothetical protein